MHRADVTTTPAQLWLGAAMLNALKRSSLGLAICIALTKVGIRRKSRWCFNTARSCHGFEPAGRTATRSSRPSRADKDCFKPANWLREQRSGIHDSHFLSTGGRGALKDGKDR
jgi:hypothetical protein